MPRVSRQTKAAVGSDAELRPAGKRKKQTETSKTQTEPRLLPEPNFVSEPSIAPLKPKLGRPSSYTEELADEVCTRIAAGSASLRTLCEEDGMPPLRTVFRWLRTYPEFAEQYALAKCEQAEVLVEEMLAIADDTARDTIATERGDVQDKEWLARSKLRVETRRWIASKLLPKKYGDKVELTGAGAKGEVTMELALTEERRRAIMEQRRAAIEAMGGTSAPAGGDDE